MWRRSTVPLGHSTRIQLISDSFATIDDPVATTILVIRAPRIRRTGPTVQVMAALKGEPVMVRQGNVVGATFHPELAPGGTIHARVFA